MSNEHLPEIEDVLTQRVNKIGEVSKNVVVLPKIDSNTPIFFPEKSEDAKTEDFKVLKVIGRGSFGKVKK